MGWKEEALAKRPKGSPLTPFVKGWRKSISGKLTYIAGKVPHAEAIEKYHLKMAQIITAGQVAAPVVPKVVAPVVEKVVVPVAVVPARKSGPAITVNQLRDKYLEHRMSLLKRGKIESTTYGACQGEVDLFCEFYGDRTVESLAKKDFTDYQIKLEQRRTSPWTMSRNVFQVKAMFKWGAGVGEDDDEDDVGRLIPVLPRFGKEFRIATKAEVTKYQGGIKRKYMLSMFEVDDIRKLLKVANVQERAMILLGLNCAYGNSDIAKLTRSMVSAALAAKTPSLEYPRWKTGENRKAFLWPETIEALKDAVPARPQPANPEHVGLVFLTPMGFPWVQASLGKNGELKRGNERGFFHRGGRFSLVVPV